ncbi:phosphatase PAP2 family protein [Pontibacter sp. JAM-7]|uniref:phosphatase PAP2 family protein n=1 Tax=Pontibacter sp. JAM-7 TaxID=3366581 RepID=UPI003AF4E0A4
MNSLQKLSHLDTLAFSWCLQLPKARLIAKISRQISRLGDGFLYLAVGVLLALFEPVDGSAFLTVGLLAFAFELPLYLILKRTIKRDRPFVVLQAHQAFIQPADRFSFPSGHASAAFVFVTVLAFFYPALLVLGYLFAVLVGAARIMLGVHFPADILAGALLGSGCAVLALRLCGYA